MNRIRFLRAAWAGLVFGMIIVSEYIVRAPESGSVMVNAAGALVVFGAAAAAGAFLESRIESVVGARHTRKTSVESPAVPADSLAA